MKSTVPSGSDVGQEKQRRSDCSATASRKGTARQKSQPRYSDSSSAAGSSAAPQASWRVVQARAGDHTSIFRFLVSVFQKPSAAEFQAQLEEPSYEPSDRLLIKSGEQIIAHLRLQNREMYFGDLTIPVSIVSDVATLPEFRGHGCASALLAEARRKMIHDGAMLGFLRTDQPQFYAQTHWVVCSRHCYSTCGPREILSHLQQREAEQPVAVSSVLGYHQRRTYNIRLWRHVEQSALLRLYAENVCASHGPLKRTEAYWRWLVGRRGNERIYVAINGPDKIELDEALSPIVGYAATKEGRILEIMCSPEHPEASIQLLARACGDAIERDFHRMRVDAPPGDPLHQLLADAGGSRFHHEADQGLVFMADLFKPRRFLKLIARRFSDRAKLAGLKRPCELGMFVSDGKFRLRVRRRGVKLIPAKLGRSYVKCSMYVFLQLLLGHLDVRDAIQEGRLSTSTRVAEEMAQALFPQIPLWRPPWDDLPA